MHLVRTQKVKMSLANPSQSLRVAALASLSSSTPQGQQNHSLLITVAAVACAVLPFDTLQLAIMLLGAIAYAVLQQSRSAAARKPALPKSKVWPQQMKDHPHPQ